MESNMNAESPILKFKEVVHNSCLHEPDDNYYNMELGYWVCKDGRPLVKLIIDSKNESPFAETTKTATREGTDQVESVFAQTTLTRSRESADQVESAVPIFAQTQITETREGVDRSERST